MKKKKTGTSNTPDGVENEKELDEDASKRQNTAHNHGWNGAGVDALRGNLARNLVGAHRL